MVDKAHEIVDSFSKQIEENELAGVIAANIFFQAEDGIRDFAE